MKPNDIKVGDRVVWPGHHDPDKPAAPLYVTSAGPRHDGVWVVFLAVEPDGDSVLVVRAERIRPYRDGMTTAEANAAWENHD